MAVVVCFNCGRQKREAQGPCGACGVTPQSEDDLALSLALTDERYRPLTLFYFGRLIAQGARPKLSAESQVEMLETIRQTRREDEMVTPQKAAAQARFAPPPAVEPVLERKLRPEMTFDWDESGRASASGPPVTVLGVFQIASGLAGTVLATAAGYANHRLEEIRLGIADSFDQPFWAQLADWTWWPAWGCWMTAAALVPIAGYLWPRFVGSAKLFIALGCAIALLVPLAYFIPGWE